MRAQDEIKLMDAKNETGTDKYMYVRDYRHIVVTVSGANSPTLTVKFAGSNQEDPPTVTSAQSPTNRYDLLQLKDLEDASTLDGDTGVAFAGTDDVRQFEINTNGMTWVIPNITAYTAGDVTVHGKAYDD